MLIGISQRRGLLLALALASAGLSTGILPGSQAPAARADEVTASQGNLRDGWDASEPGLSPAVCGRHVRPAFSTAVDGQVYGQPLVAGSTLIVTTENDCVYGLNAVSGAIEWQRSWAHRYRQRRTAART